MNQLERVARAICRVVIQSYRINEVSSEDTINADGNPLWMGYIPDAQAAIDAMQEWKAVDTAPEDVEVLVYRPIGIQKIDVMQRVEGVWYWPDGESPTSNPTHWMPLPKAP
jgi:hypothetical protein